MSEREVVHGGCVAIDGRGVVILGPPGSGKSTLALELLALGAALVADDVTMLWRDGDGLIAEAPPGAPAAIEARGVGLLPVPLIGAVRVALAVEMGSAARERLPPPQRVSLLDVEVRLFHRPTAAIIAVCLRHGAPLDPDAALAERHC